MPVRVDRLGLAPWELNRRLAWWSICFGAATGLILGLWSFDGPVPVPRWLGEYDQTARRLARLGHIACFGLGILHLLLIRELEFSVLGKSAKRSAAAAMYFGNLLLPITLFAAAAHQPLKYLMPVPALAVFFALVVTAAGTGGRRLASPEPGVNQNNENLG